MPLKRDEPTQSRDCNARQRRSSWRANRRSERDQWEDRSSFFRAYLLAAKWKLISSPPSNVLPFAFFSTSELPGGCCHRHGVECFISQKRSALLRKCCTSRPLLQPTYAFSDYCRRFPFVFPLFPACFPPFFFHRITFPSPVLFIAKPRRLQSNFEFFRVHQCNGNNAYSRAEFPQPDVQIEMILFGYMYIRISTYQ